MRRSSCVCLLALVSLTAAAVPARAEVFLRVPFVTLALGRPAYPDSPGVVVNVPFVSLRVARSAPTGDVPPGTVVSTPTELPPPRPLPSSPPAEVRPMTVAEFAAHFKPAPGTYEVLLIHPGSGCAVPVQFTLPCGCPKVRVHRRQIDFDYGRDDVSIRSQICNKVKVSYH